MPGQEKAIADSSFSNILPCLVSADGDGDHTNSHLLGGDVVKRRNPLPRHVFVCSGCGRSIYEGEWFLDEGGEQYCTQCRPLDHKIATYVKG